MQDEFVPTLIKNLRGRLHELDEERRGIKRALRILQTSDRHPRRSALNERLAERIRVSPGSRTSLLALELGVSPSSVRTQLEALEQRGLIVRQGLGWAPIGLDKDGR